MAANLDMEQALAASEEAYYFANQRLEDLAVSYAEEKLRADSLAREVERLNVELCSLARDLRESDEQRDRLIDRLGRAETVAS